MEKQDDIVYEVYDPISNKGFTTWSRDEIISFFEEEWVVIERHTTKYRPSLYTESQIIVSIFWNNNPEFEGV